MSAADNSNGGKFRKKPFRRHQATPYDRPPTALRISPQRNNGWLSRLVDPASKLIASGAHKLFASVFRKRLLPPPSPTPPSQQQSSVVLSLWYLAICSDGNEERRKSMLKAASTDHLRAQEQTTHDTRSLKASRDNDELAELEQILREKNFTRSELNRLTALLHSNTIRMPTGAGTEKSDATPEKNHDNQSRDMEVINGPVLEHGIESNVLTGATSTPDLRKNVVEENMASPVDLAKAYMASRSAKMSPSMSSLRSQVHGEDPLFSGSSSHMRSPNISLAPKPSSSVSIYENAIVMPRSRGKSTIYSMPRLPYSRVYPTTNKGNGPALVAGSSSSSSFQCSLEDSQFNERKKSALKRRSSVVDNDIGSSGPIRCIRQKPNLLSPRTVISGTSHAAQGSDIGAAGVVSPMMRITKGHSSLNSSAESIDGKLNNPSSVYNPSRSIELGQKILQQLDKLSPKEKLKERSLKFAAGRSPSELTADMLHGQARRSLETVDSFKIFQHVQQNTNRTGALDVVSDVSNSKHKKEDRSNGLKGPGNASVKLPPVSTAEGGLPVKASLSTSTAINAADGKIYDPPKKSGAFQMSAHEEYLDVEDDVRSNGDMSASLSEWKKDDSNVNSKVLIGEKKAIDVVISPVLEENVSLEKVPLFSAPKSSPVSVENKIKEPEQAAVADSVAEANNDFTFSFMGKTGVVIQTLESGKEVVAPQSNTGASAFSLPQKSSDLMSPLPFSPPSFPTESSGSKGTKPELSGSFAAVTSTSVASTTFPEHNKVHDKGHDNAGNISKMEETPSSSATGFASGSFSFNVPGSNPIVGNGIIGSGSKAASAASPVLFSDIETKQSFSTPSTCAAAVPTVTVSSFADAIKEASPIVVDSNSGFSIKSSTPLTSIFKFSTEEQPPASESRASTSFDSESTQSGLKPKESGFDSQSSSSFSFPSSVTANVDTGFFGFKASTSANDSESTQSGLKPKDSGFGSQSSPSFSFPSSVAANADAGLFGFKASTSANDSSFTSSLAAFNRFASGSAMGSNSAGSSSMTASLSTTSMSSSSVSIGTLGSSWQSSNPLVFNKTFSSSSTPMFSFGATGSTSVSGASSAPMVFGTAGSSSTPAFSFAASSPAPWNPISPSQPSLGSTNSTFTFGLTSTSNNNDQMNMEDSMAEDSVWSSAAAVPGLSQLPVATPPSTGFFFGTTLPAANPFQFGGQTNHQTAAQSPGTGSFSFGAGGNDKSARKIIKVRKQLRKR